MAVLTWCWFPWAEMEKGRDMLDGRQGWDLFYLSIYLPACCFYALLICHVPSIGKDSHCACAQLLFLLLPSATDHRGGLETFTWGGEFAFKSLLGYDCFGMCGQGQVLWRETTARPISVANFTLGALSLSYSPASLRLEYCYDATSWHIGSFFWHGRDWKLARRMPPGIIVARTTAVRWQVISRPRLAVSPAWNGRHVHRLWTRWLLIVHRRWLELVGLREMVWRETEVPCLGVVASDASTCMVLSQYSSTF